MPVWPPPGMPASRIRTLDPDREPRFAFGTCRTTGAHDSEGNGAHGVDALRTLAVELQDDPEAEWPDLLLLLGDQVYADTTPHPELEEFMAARRDLSEPPGEEIKDLDEYAELYRLAWSDDVIRWMLSTVPSAMMFDDHDIRDDWNTSWSWREEMRATGWWQERITSGLASYWVHQHIGNLSPAQLAEEEVWRSVAAHAASGHSDELDLTDRLDALAARADAEPATYRWSYTRALGDCTLVILDSRAARELRPDGRSILDAVEMSWLDETLRGDVRHLLIGTSLPFLLPPGLHDFEAMNEVMAEGAYGRPISRAAERLRRSIDLEHWAAFNEGFDEVFEMVMEVARGERGAAPDTVTFLSGDVHNSYLAEVTDPERLGATVARRAGGVLPHPQPHAEGHPGGHVPLRPLPGASHAAPRIAVQPSARPALPLDGHRRAVVRQQHRHLPGRRGGTGDRVVHRRRGGRPQPPAAGAGVCRAHHPLSAADPARPRELSVEGA